MEMTKKNISGGYQKMKDRNKLRPDVPSWFTF